MVNVRNLALDAREFTLPVLVSFETGEQVAGLRVKLPPNVDARLVGVDYEVVKALGITDAGLIDLKTPAGAALAITQISIPAASALGVRGSATLSTTDANLRIGVQQANAHHELTTAKTTAGGKVQLWLHYRKIGKGSAQA